MPANGICYLRLIVYLLKLKHLRDICQTKAILHSLKNYDICMYFALWLVSGGAGLSLLFDGPSI